MARAEDERTHSASSEEYDGSSEQLSQSESDKNTPSTPTTNKKPFESSKQPVQPAPDVTSSEEDESGSESDSDSDSVHSPMNSGEPVPAVCRTYCFKTDGKSTRKCY